MKQTLTLLIALLFVTPTFAKSHSHHAKKPTPKVVQKVEEPKKDLGTRPTPKKKL